MSIILRWEKAAVLLSKQWAPSSTSQRSTQSVPCRPGKTRLVEQIMPHCQGWHCVSLMFFVLFPPITAWTASGWWNWMKSSDKWTSSSPAQVGSATVSLCIFSVSMRNDLSFMFGRRSWKCLRNMQFSQCSFIQRLPVINQLLGSAARELSWTLNWSRELLVSLLHYLMLLAGLKQRALLRVTAIEQKNE